MEQLTAALFLIALVLPTQVSRPQKEPFFRVLPLIQESGIFQFPDHRRRNSYDKAVQKIAMINHIKWFFITANTWLLG